MLAVKSLLLTMTMVLACSPQEADLGGTASALRGADANEPLESTTLKLQICQVLENEYDSSISDAACLAGEFTVNQKFFPADDPDYLTMMYITTKQTLDAHLNTCDIVLKRDWSNLDIDGEGNIIGAVSWRMEINQCLSESEYMLTDEEHQTFQLLMDDVAAEYADLNDGDWDDFCPMNGQYAQGNAQEYVDLETKTGGGSVSVECDENGDSQDIQYCEISFEMDASDQIDLNSVEVTYCDF